MAHAGADVDIDGHRMLGTYSTDDEKMYLNDDRNRRFYLQPEHAENDIYFDYGEAFNNYTHRARSGQNRNLNVYGWMQDHRQVLIDSEILDTNQSRLNVDFVSHSSILAELLEAGANKTTNSGVAVTLFRGTYHIRKTGRGTYWAQQQAVEKPDIDSQKIAASTQLLFQYVTSKDGRTPDEPAPMNANASFYSMMTVNCGDHRILFSGEMQAERRVNADEPPPVCLDPRNYLNVRTKGRNQIVRPMKALRWWAPNKISGIPEIVCGLRDDERGIIQGLEYVNTERLTRENYARDWWNASDCIRTLESLLSQIKELVQGDDPNTVYHGILELEPVEGEYGPRFTERLRNRRFRLRDRRDDDAPYTDDNIIRNILEGNID